VLQFTPLHQIGGCRDSGGDNSFDVGDNNDSDSEDSNGDGDGDGNGDGNRPSGDGNGPSGSNDAVELATAVGRDDNQLKVVTTKSTAATTRQR